MAGEGFEFSPLGAVPLGTGQAVWAELNGQPAQEMAPSIVQPQPSAPLAYDIHTTALGDVQRAFERHAKALARPATSPRSVIRGARERVKEIRAELRRMKALQGELAELERLLAAAKAKPPRAIVRAIDARRTG